MWHSAAKLSDIPKEGAASVEVAGARVALFHTSGKVYALADACMHRGGPLGQGHLEDGRVTCPWHAWEFDVKTGACLTMEGVKQRTYPTKVERDEIWIDL